MDNAMQSLAMLSIVGLIVGLTSLALNVLLWRVVLRLRREPMLLVGRISDQEFETMVLQDKLSKLVKALSQPPQGASK